MESWRWLLGVALLAAMTGCSQRGVGSPQPQAADWDDRTIYRSGLVAGAQGALDELPEASVYHLDVQIANDLRSLAGRQEVRYTHSSARSESLDTVCFQLFPNMMGGRTTISAATVDEQVVEPSYLAGESAVRVALPQALAPGASAVIAFDFEVTLPQDAGGNYGLFGYIDGILALDGFYPAIPVYDDAGWRAGPIPPNADYTFQEASFYRVRVTAPRELTLAASGVEIARERQGRRQIVTYAAGPARAFYLAGSKDYIAVSDQAGDVKVNSYALKGREEGARAALKTAVKALGAFEARLGEYPYTEFDVASTPMQGAWGIEYPGVTGINYALYDLDETFSGAPAPVMMESVVAHELGHQWFYNVVGNDQINEPWLDEALVQYLTGLYFYDAYGAQGMAQYRATWLSRWDRVGRQPIPVGLPAGEYEGKEYGAIVYGRGPLFMEALAERMGQDMFDAFLRDYYESHLWGVGTGEAFKSMAEEHCGCDLTPLFEEWVYE